MKEQITFETGNICYVLDASGMISRIVSARYDLLNSMIPAAADGGIGEIVLRVYRNDKMEIYPLTGRDAHYTLFACKEGLCYRSEFGSFSARVCFLPGSDGWLWTVDLQGAADAFDLLYLQDIGLAEMAAQRTNELYTAQYLAHHAYQGANGFLIASRQNLPQGGRHPCLWQGMLKGKAVSFATDGTQYFGNSFRLNRIPAARKSALPGTVLQGESACIALQTERIPLAGSWSCSFFALYQEDHPEVLSANECPELSSLFRLASKMQAVVQAPKRSHAMRKPISVYASSEMTEAAVYSRYPERELEERDADGNLLSFFLPDHRHVVLQRKELLCERPHGTILTTLFDAEKLPDNLLTTTAYMYGNFACQTVVGNTSLHKLTSVSRGRYDWLPFSGTRLLIRQNEKWVQLGMPALFEMDFHSAKWVYILPDDELDVQVWMGAAGPGMKWSIQSMQGKKYDFLLTMQLVMGDREFDQSFDLHSTAHSVVLRMGAETFCKYEQLSYSIQPSCPFILHRDECFFGDGQVHDDSLLTFEISDQNHFEVMLHGDLYGLTSCPVESIEEEKAKYHAAYRDFLEDISIMIPQDQKTAARINHTVYWFLHNAMVHFCVPHGLEQSGGAAWGTRDVCQGPFELILATGHFALARKLLVRVFEHQCPNGDWPQWFMFDRYAEIRAGESHGDIVLWPLKALGDYLHRTGDMDLLSESIASACETEQAPLRDLLKRSFTLIEGRFIPETDFLRYGNGDWDDTLQPADRELPDRMASTWTQALAYQTINLFANASFPDEIAVRAKSLARRLQNGFGQMTTNTLIPGFCLTDGHGGILPMIFPNDAKTGIHYRLIPYTRAILSGLADSERAESYLALIKKHLLAPDGARLLSRPTHYSGGNCRFFLRAEQAVNVGREISLQYVHAHIRYTGALAKCRKAEDCWNALLQVTPPLLSASVPNAMLRQSNLYFTSSDADVPNRASFEEKYAEVMQGSVPVKGGWRLYSSGPGIYLALLLNDILNIHGNSPVIPKQYDGLTVTLTAKGLTRQLKFCASEDRYQISEQSIVDTNLV